MSRNLVTPLLVITLPKFSLQYAITALSLTLLYVHTLTHLHHAFARPLANDPDSVGYPSDDGQLEGRLYGARGLRSHSAQR